MKKAISRNKHYSLGYKIQAIYIQWHNKKHSSFIYNTRWYDMKYQFDKVFYIPFSTAIVIIL